MIKLAVKYPGLTWEGPPKLSDSSMGEGSGISGVAVKCVDIWRNISGESDFLVQH